MLQFAHPAYLWGALAVSVPILVHLFNRRRPRPLPFGAIEFVLRSQKQKSRKLRLRQLILLALRCLLVLGVALALARPSIVPKDAQAATLLGPQATALVLDASLSMRAHDGDQVLFESARAEALAALDHLMPEEPATAVICAGTQGAQGQIAAPSFDRVAVRRQLSQAQAGFVAGDLTACLTQAAKALAASPVPGKRIIAFSDLAAHGFRLSAPPPLVPASPEAPEGKGVRPNVVLVDATRQHELPNVSVTGVSVQPAPRLGPRGYEVSALISNFSTQALSGAQVVLRIGGQVVAKGFVDLPAHGSAKKTLGALLPPGLQAGRIELTPRAESGLDDDDGQDFLVQVPRDLKVLIVDGAPASLRTRDEAWFVEAALAPQRSAGRMIPTVLDAGAVEGKTQAELDDFDVALLLNVAAPKKPFADKLRAFVMRGGGLFIALGDNVDPDAYNDSLKGLLPRPLHLLKTALDPDQPDVPQGAPDRAARFGLIDWTHPLFRVFGPQEREAVESVRTFRYALLKPEGTGRALVSFDDGAPALVEANVGAGRVLLLTTSASATWTDWPIRPSFLPVMQQATSLLAGALDEKPSGNAEVGELRALQTPEGQKLERVLGPDGKDVPLVRDEATPGELKVPVSRPGVHHVMLSSAGQPPHEDPALSFVARLDPKEADLTRVDEREVKAWLGGGQTAQVASSSREAQGNHGTPLWGFLFVLAALAVLGEGALTRK